VVKASADEENLALQHSINDGEDKLAQ